MNTKASISLANYLKRRKAVSDTALFINRFGKQLSSRGVEKIVNKYMFQASIRNASVQSLRHTFGIHHIVSGAKLKMIQEVMGHRDSRTTSMYQALVKGGLSKEIQDHTL